jgi:hypothetical protein
MENGSENKIIYSVPANRTNKIFLSITSTTIILLCWITHLLLLWLYRFVPSIDYPDWLLQANILAHYNNFSQWYQILPIPIPNGGFVLPTAALAVYFPVEIAGKIILSIYVIWFPLAVRSYFGVVGNKSSFWMIGILLLFNVSFIFGNIAFLIGTCLLLTTLTFWERHRMQLNLTCICTAFIFTIILYFTHAICALVFFIYLFILLTEPRLTKKQITVYIINIFILILLGLWYYLARPSDRPSDEFIWGLYPRSRASLLMKSFIAGWAFPPYEFSWLRTSGTALMLAAIIVLAFIGFKKAIIGVAKSPATKLIIVVCIMTIFAPNVILGNSEMPQRLSIISLMLLAGFITFNEIKRLLLLILLAISILYVTIIRIHDYKNSSYLLQNRYEFLKSVIPTSQSYLTFDDDLGANRTPFLYLVPKGMHFIFQTDYFAMESGYSPLLFRSGYVLPRDEFFLHLDSLTTKRIPEGLLKLTGKDIPLNIGYIIIDTGSGWGEQMTANLFPEFQKISEKDIKNGVSTIILRRKEKGS